MIRKTFLTLWLMLVMVSVVSAKIDPYVENPEAEWGDLSNPASIWSWQALAAQVGRLGMYGDVDAFTVNFPEATAGWNFEMMVPVCGDHFKNFFPSVAVIGPGLDAPEAGALPFELPEGTGAVIFSEETYKAGLAENGQRSVTTNNIVTGEPVYFNTARTVDIPQAGDYIVAVFEPEGNVGAYMLSIAGADDLFGNRNNAELDAAFDLLFSGEWMGQDCAAPLAAADCPATGGIVGDAQIPDAPERWQVGDEFTVTGVVRDSSTCLPIAEAQITFWMANAEGEYDGVGEGTLHTNGQGGYRIDSARPGQYDNVTPHIHMAVSAPGYETIVTELLFDGEIGESAVMDMALRPA